MTHTGFRTVLGTVTDLPKLLLVVALNALASEFLRRTPSFWADDGHHGRQEVGSCLTQCSLRLRSNSLADKRSTRFSGAHISIMGDILFPTGVALITGAGSGA
jgi:hypothetical protein